MDGLHACNGFVTLSDGSEKLPTGFLNLSHGSRTRASSASNVRIVAARSPGSGIAVAMQLSKPTLIKWGRQHQFEIANLRAIAAARRAEIRQETGTVHFAETCQHIPPDEFVHDREEWAV
jgi:hypothetical protein